MYDANMQVAPTTILKYSIYEYVHSTRFMHATSDIGQMIKLLYEHVQYYPLYR